MRRAGAVEVLGRLRVRLLAAVVNAAGAGNWSKLFWCAGTNLRDCAGALADWRRGCDSFNPQPKAQADGRSKPPRACVVNQLAGCAIASLGCGLND